jgi:large subunit ribosomal protein L4e
MKLTIYNTQKSKSGEKDVPSVFAEEFRPGLIRRAVLSLQSMARQAYGASPDAGMRHSSKLSKRRRKYRGCYGFGISRVNRKILSRRGTRMFWVGAFSPQTRGGRRSHAPKSEKIFDQKINKKENRKAIRSAIAASQNKSLVEKRGHKIPSEYPFVISNDFETIAKTKDVKSALSALGFNEELERSLVKKIRAGIGTMRGRKYKRRKGVLLVVGKDCPLVKSATNIPGVDIALASSLNAELLAPGASAGRATLFTEGAIDLIAKENLYN